MTIQKEALIKLALKEKESAYCPYSNFSVGAAVQTDQGDLFGGFNIENASFGATNCAERTAVFRALHQGFDQLVAVAVAGDPDNFTFPCGICRQVLAEFGGPDMVVYVAKNEEEVLEYRLEELLPGAFTGRDLEARHV